MRFAYIDSQGNEVGIPSVDALALRIEVGAIGPETQLYDAQAERWGPAESHEIFHTLSRDVAGDAFVVPEPPPPDPEPDTPDPGTPETPPHGALGPDPDGGADGEPGDGPSVPPEGDPPAMADDLGLTLVPSEEEVGSSDVPPETRDESPEAPDEGQAIDDLPLDLAPSDAAAGDATDADDTPPAEDLPSPVEGAYEEAPFDFGLSPADAVDGGSEQEGGEQDDGSLDLEPPLSFGETPPDDDDMAGGIDLEPPMSDFDPSTPPAWMEQDGPEGMDTSPDPAMDFSAGLEDDEAVGGQAGPPDPPSGGGTQARGATSGPPPDGSDRRPERPQRPTPRRPPRRRRRSRAPLLALLLAAALGAGGWYGWQAFGERVAPPPPRAPVVLPEIPADLEPPMRELAEAALPRMFERIEARTFTDDAPTAPSDDWLAGVYLGNASRFGDVETFWAGIAELATRLGDEEVTVFHDAYAALADSSDLAAESVNQVVERADSGFMATRPARLEIYERLRTVADASLALHAFLLTHESDIAYAPARGFSGNPIEEAVPATDEIRDRMWDLVEEITSALDALGTLDRVTRERLSTVVVRRIEEIGIR